ncbi:MAG TPA: glycerol-3-phosphate 1-O-acyltransferase PlsY [Burkholderiales bacterium]|nr:glycerol-3-phosphate 1-O-acyltransferase PlsY [Burkholderiales bacterium]
MTAVILALVAYLIGSISFAVVVSRALALPDPRSYGSRNPGATNVLRTGKKPAALLTLLGDSLKGTLAVVIARHFAEPNAVELAMGAAAFAVVLGHVFPVFFGFKGGKGVSTALGVLLGLDVYLALGTAATWIIIALFFRISSLAAIVAAVFAPFGTLLIYDAAHPFFIGVCAISALLIWRHQSNIRNLLAGTETRLGR